MAAEVIESFGAGQRAGQSAADVAGKAFVGDTLGVLLEQITRRKPPALQILPVKR